MSEELCPNCGAPHAAGYAACKFCKTPFVANTQTNAIPCPRCGTLNEMGAQKCVQCQTWVVVQCVFCHALSPHNAPACTHCSEAFAGAPERFAHGQSQQRVQQGLNIAGTVGNVAASFLGAAAGAGLFSGHSHHGYEHHQRYGEPRYGDPQGSGGDWDNSGGTGAGIAVSQEPDADAGSGGGGFFDSLFGSSDAGTGAGISTESDDSSSSSSSDDSGSFFGSSNDDS